MPLYVYSCRTCDIVLDALRPIELADFPPVECPVCHGLCEREVALFNIGSAGATRDPDNDDLAGVGASAPPDAVNLLHEPGCPCCGGMRR